MFADGNAHTHTTHVYYYIFVQCADDVMMKVLASHSTHPARQCMMHLLFDACALVSFRETFVDAVVVCSDPFKSIVDSTAFRR